MYVCNCNGITERQVKTALRSGVERWHDVHAHYGCVPACGKCKCEIKDAMDAHCSETVDEHRAETKPQAMPIFGNPALAAT